MSAISMLSLLLISLIAACYSQSGFTFEGGEYKCEGDESCAGLTDTQLVETLLCKGFCSCCGSVFLFGCDTDKCSIECEEEDSCTGSYIAMDNVESVSCGEPRACAQSQFYINAVNGAKFECSDEEACIEGNFVISMDTSLSTNHLDELQCDGEGTCAGSYFYAERVENLSCEGYGACFQTAFDITNPARDFSLQCEGDRACSNAAFYMQFTADAPDLYIKSIECEAPAACEDTTITVDNLSASTVVIEQLKCEGFQTCSRLAFVVSAGSVQINQCICEEPEGYGCLCTEGLDAVCQSFEGIWNSASAAYACA